MAEIAFLSLAAYLVWYGIRHLRNEHSANGGFLTHPYGHPANGETFPDAAEQPAPTRQPASVGSLDDQPAEVIAEAARKAFGD